MMREMTIGDYFQISSWGKPELGGAPKRLDDRFANRASPGRERVLGWWAGRLKPVIRSNVYRGRTSFNRMK